MRSRLILDSSTICIEGYESPSDSSQETAADDTESMTRIFAKQGPYTGGVVTRGPDYGASPGIPTLVLIHLPAHCVAELHPKNLVEFEAVGGRRATQDGMEGRDVHPRSGHDIARSETAVCQDCRPPAGGDGQPFGPDGVGGATQGEAR